MNRLRGISLVLCVFSAFLGVIGCLGSSQEREFARAEKAASAKEYQEALDSFRRVVETEPESVLGVKAAQQGARLAQYELKDFLEAIRLYKNVVLYSRNPRLRQEAQRHIAELHFNQTLNYEEAVVEYNRLLELPQSPKQALADRLALARSYFYLSHFFQAQVEIDKVVQNYKDAPQLFDALLLKANILLTTKMLDDAISVLRDLIARYPERSKAEMIALVLAVCYEEQKSFDKAIETLESLKDIYPRKAFIERRIKALRERESYLPGAKGLRK